MTGGAQKEPGAPRIQEAGAGECWIGVWRPATNPRRFFLPG